MTIDLYELFAGSTALTLFLTVFLGYLVGKIHYRQFALGSTAGVLMISLTMGHFGFSAPAAIKDLGFIVFIFSVGMVAGPRFFSVLLENGVKYIGLALFTAVTALTLTKILAGIFQFEYGYSAGLMAGALTSTPTLAAAQDAVTSGAVTTPAGISSEEAAAHVTEAYAITYIFGTIGLMLLVKFVPRLFRDNLVASAKKAEAAMNMSGSDARIPNAAIRAYEVSNAVMTGKPITQIPELHQWEIGILKIKRHGEWIDLHQDCTLESGDRITVGFNAKNLAYVHPLFGPEITDGDLVDVEISEEELVVSSQQAAGKKISSLSLITRFQATIVRVVRSRIELEPSPDLVLLKGDTITIKGVSENMTALKEFMGIEEDALEKTDLVTFSLGIIAGLLIAQITIQLGEINIGLGLSGGLLISGILIGYLRTSYPVFGGLPRAARWLLMELGLLFFMAGVGLNAGAGIWEALQSVGPQLFVCGITVTVLPVLLAYAFGKWALRLEPAILLGGITGSMTSTPALSMVNEEAKSSVPSLGYAGTYAFANVILTLCGSLIMRL
ncbi:MAG: TrkA C-terminal domain-containing protein [Verrucomicrobiota bacterium]